MKPADTFWSPHYLRHNQRRQEHLASLRLPLAEQTVLEVGAGIGDHTSFFLDRRCTVVSTEPQEQNLAILRGRYPELDIRKLDLNTPPPDPIEADIVYCYGVLYHLERPSTAIAYMADCAKKLLLLETCVAFGDRDEVLPFEERAGDPDNAVTGHGCRPTRSWVRRELATHFEHVYVPLSQPWHEEFPLNWSSPELEGNSLIRSVFIASRTPLTNDLLLDGLPDKQVHI
jgi:hypothetical protein